MTAVELLITTGCAVAFYLVLSNRLLRWTQAVRLDMASVGEDLLQDDRLSPDQKRSVESRLNKAFSTPKAWMYAALATPAAIATLVDYCKGRKDYASSMPDDLRASWVRFSMASLVSILGNSPAAALLLVLQTILFGVLFVPLGRFMRELLRVTDVVSNHIEHDNSRHNHA
jgi:hypothetical protein